MNCQRVFDSIPATLAQAQIPHIQDRPVCTPNCSQTQYSSPTGDFESYFFKFVPEEVAMCGGAMGMIPAFPDGSPQDRYPVDLRCIQTFSRMSGGFIGTQTDFPDSTMMYGACANSYGNCGYQGCNKTFPVSFGDNEDIQTQSMLYQYNV